MSEPTSFCPALPCASCDAWLGLVGKRVLAVTDHEDVLVVTMESVADVTGWPRCGVIASGQARDTVTLIDAPSFGRAVRLVWHKRRYACHEGACAMTTFVEQADTVAAPRALLTARAVSWSLAQLRAELNRPALGTNLKVKRRRGTRSSALRQWRSSLWLARLNREEPRDQGSAPRAARPIGRTRS